MINNFLPVSETVSVLEEYEVCFSRVKCEISISFFSIIARLYRKQTCLSYIPMPDELVCWRNRSTVKVHTQPRSPKDHACDVINYLSSVLFPPGISNAPIEQLQQFYGSAFANRMVSANEIDKRNVAGSTAAASDGEFESLE